MCWLLFIFDMSFTTHLTGDARREESLTLKGLDEVSLNQMYDLKVSKGMKTTDTVYVEAE